MKGRWHVLISLVLSAFLVFTSAKAADDIDPPTPTLMGNVLMQNPAQGPGAWYLGAAPRNVDKTKAPVVFVHGIHGKPNDWWGETRYYGGNDTYKLAHEQGYRTSFVQLYDENKGATDQWVNGKTLAKLIKKISEHYGEKVNIVAHSKGGIDAQTALVHYKAYPYVKNLITIASPHHGCYLADLAHSWYLGWLGSLLNVKDEGTFALQTANMAEFRQETDTLPSIEKTPNYTLSGTGWGPYPSALWLGGLYLWQYDHNDGMITEDSTHLPYAKHLGILDADHDLIRQGSTLLPAIESVLSSDYQVDFLPPTKRLRENAEVTEQYVNGGEVKARRSVEQSVSVESSTKEVTFSIMTKSPKINVFLVSPTGRKYTKSSGTYFSSEGLGLFEDAAVQSYRIENPEKGSWKIHIQNQGKEKDAFFLTTYFKGPSTYSLQMPYQSMKKEVPLDIRINDIHDFDLNSVSVNMKVVESSQARIQSRSFEAKLNPSSIRGHYAGHIAGVTESGLYNVTIEITGKTKDGIPYQRSIIRSVRVGDAVSR